MPSHQTAAAMQARLPLLDIAALGLEAVTEADMALAANMADAVRQHPYAGLLLAEGKAEQSFWADDIATGLRVKARPDWYFKATPLWT
jgi:hypothetical protein